MQLLRKCAHRVYLTAVENTFGSEIDYAMLMKVYGRSNRDDERRYSTVECTGAEIVACIITSAGFTRR
jgi:hypothetical protein